MSNRYNINLINTKTGKYRYHQLFGNNDSGHKCNAIENINIKFTDHSYLDNHLEPISLDYKGEPIIIGNLKPEFELTISWD